MILLISSFACRPACGPTKVVDDAACPVSACATECNDLESGSACCIETFGRGLGDQIETLTVECEGESCDPALYISEEAAVCIAQVHGMSQGINDCAAAFQYDRTEVSRWLAANELERECSGGMGWSSGDIFLIDARSGEFMGIGSVESDFVCDV